LHRKNWLLNVTPIGTFDTASQAFRAPMAIKKLLRQEQVSLLLCVACFCQKNL